jgi:plastocyanin
MRLTTRYTIGAPVRLIGFAAAAVLITLTRCSASGTARGQVANAPIPSDAPQVVIWDYKFQPKTLTVPVGTRVTWVNRDMAPHTATSRSFGEATFDSGRLTNNEMFSREFRTPGTYDYLCVYHTGMRGVIVVH